ncbi:hypothetical protein CBR_g4033 [Chara braunii]|uniref:Phosphoadenosine phosphosulphate reductase domain-containing protein n=1 Tax=Chara braunii TaxID=69332 RepID=A0A388KH65_CHABU|nr:hypothetical protein CBR_g4033 [Chara braunii]|eukprot:GBG69337.1 hypothetical protein CBR_g4033 [Chara braunii]
MEVFEVMRMTADAELVLKFQSAIGIIERAISQYGFEGVAFSFNGGKDSTVLLHLLRAVYARSAIVSPKHSSVVGNEDQLQDGFIAGPIPRIRTIYFESEDAFPQIQQFTTDMAEQ